MTNTEREDELRRDIKELLQKTGDAIVGVYEQMLKGNWVDDHGHLVAKNSAMLETKNALNDIMAFRTKHLGYPPHTRLP